MRKREQLELTRHNVTPAQFLAYVRQQIRKHNFNSISADDIQLEYWKNGGDLEFDYHDVTGKPCKAEKSVSQPYKMQTYILNWDGTVYNLIAEFEFDDDKRGWGYFYFINTWDVEEPEEVKPEEPETVEDSNEEKGENTMFEKIREEINKHEREQLTKTENALHNMTAGAVLDSWYYRGLCTPKVFEAVKALDAGEKLGDDLIAKMMKKRAREEAKSTKIRIDKLNKAEGAADVQQITVTVEWIKSRTWGKNPHATVYGRNSITKDFATGCGYDKESAAIAGAFNNNPEVMRILYKHLENNGKDFPYGVHVYGGLVTFDGGCGVSTFYNIFDALGYEFKQVVSGQHCAAYRVTKKA